MGSLCGNSSVLFASWVGCQVEGLHHVQQTMMMTMWVSKYDMYLCNYMLKSRDDDVKSLFKSWRMPYINNDDDDIGVSKYDIYITMPVIFFPL